MNKGTECEMQGTAHMFTMSVLLWLWPSHAWQQMGQFPRKCPMFYNIITIKNALRVNRRSVRTVNAVDFLFSPHDAIPFLCG